MNDKLPLFLSIPHCGANVPNLVRNLCLLNDQQILLDGDTGANEIYGFVDQVSDHLRAEVARAIVDLNRAETDRRAHGVVKESTI